MEVVPGTPRFVAGLVALSTVAPAGVVATRAPAGGIALFLPLLAVGAVAILVLRVGPLRARGWLALGLALLALGACATPFVPPEICGGMALPLGVAGLLAARNGSGLAVVWAALCAVAAIALGGGLIAGVFAGHLIDLAERRAPVLLGGMALVPIAAIGFLIAAGIDTLGGARGSAP